MAVACYAANDVTLELWKVASSMRGRPAKFKWHLQG